MMRCWCYSIQEWLNINIFAAHLFIPWSNLKLLVYNTEQKTVPRKTGFIVKIKKIYIYILISIIIQVYPILSILKTKWGTVLCRKWAGNRPFCLCQSKNYYRPYAPRLALSQNGHHFVYTLYLKMCKVFRKEYLRLSPKSEKEHVSFLGLKREYPVCQ